MNKQQSGFTLIELIMVIVILGILSAFALPRFADLSGEAQIAAVEGALGSAKSASAIAHSACLVSNTCNPNAASGENVTLEGQTVKMVYGYPALTDICVAASLVATDFSCNTTTGIVAPGPTAAEGDPCFTYTPATGTGSPVVVTAPSFTAVNGNIQADGTCSST